MPGTDPNAAPELPRLRQAVLAASDLDAVVSVLREQLGLGEPFADPGVAYFGLRNAVFALGDTFLEVVSPTREDTAAGRLLERRGGDCGYMLMFQVKDLVAARARAAAASVREVFEVDLEDIAEVHLHPADMRGAIVSLSTPRPPSSWRWGGPDWSARSAPGVRIAGATVAVKDPGLLARRWSSVIGSELERAGIRVAADDSEPGLVEVVIACSDEDARARDDGGQARDDLVQARDPIQAGGVRFSFLPKQEHLP